MTHSTSVNNVLVLRHAIDGSATLRPIIDGHDMLADYRHDRGLDPDRLLPPLTKTLLPTRAGHRSLIGSCCEAIGCGSLSLRLRRDGRHVIWEPADTHGRTRESIRRTYRFELEQYLDAVDTAAQDRPGEGRGRRVARKVTTVLRDHAELMDDSPPMTRGIDWVAAYPYDSPVVRACLAAGNEQVLYEIHPWSSESDDQLVRRVVEELHEQLVLLEPPWGAASAAPSD